jgi:hypothetical protein
MDNTNRCPACDAELVGGSCPFISAPWHDDPVEMLPDLDDLENLEGIA